MKTCRACPKAIGPQCKTGLCRRCYWRQLARQKRGVDVPAEVYLTDRGSHQEPELGKPVIHECCGSTRYLHTYRCKNRQVARPGDPTRNVRACYICKAPSYRKHAPDCHFAKMRNGTPPARAAEITAYICALGHQFISNLAQGSAICPECNNREIHLDPAGRPTL